MEKEIAITDRMCPCAARWSMIAIGMGMHPCAARWSMIAIGMDLLPVWLYASVVICAAPQAIVVFQTHTGSFPL